MKLKFVILCSLTLLIIFSSQAQQPDSSIEKAHFEFTPSFKSIQIDGSTIFFAYDYGLSADIDFVRYKAIRDLSLGTRIGKENTGWRGVGGGGSDCHDYYLMVRSTVSSKHFRFDILGGYSYQVIPAPTKGGGTKIGIELRWKIIPSIFGMLAKINGNTLSHNVFLGVGLYIGYDR